MQSLHNHKRTIIWALFDDASRSYYHSLHSEGVQVISIGINPILCFNYRQIDLSITNNKLIKQLSKLPKPDIILASPPCESWSIADNQRRAIKKLNNIDDNILYMELRNKSFYDQNNIDSINFLKRDFYKQHKTRINGECTALATLQIIDHFKPKYWVIENPQSSKIWDYMRNMNPTLNGIKNLAHYNNYDSNYTTKPTYFLSNVGMILKHEKITQNKKWSDTRGYDLRSSIPSKLIEHIYNQILEEHIMRGGDKYE